MTGSNTTVHGRFDANDGKIFMFKRRFFFREIMAKFLLLHCAGRLLSQLSLENSVGIVSCCNVSIEANPFLT